MPVQRDKGKCSTKTKTKAPDLTEWMFRLAFVFVDLREQFDQDQQKQQTDLDLHSLLFQ